MFKEKEFSKKSQLVLRTLFACSLPFMTLLFLRSADLWVVITSMIGSFIIGILLLKFVFKNLFSKINVGYFAIAFLFGLYIARYYYNIHVYGIARDLTLNYDDLMLPIDNVLCSRIVVVLASFTIITLVYLALVKIWPVIKDFYLNLSKGTQKYLKISLVVTFFATMILYYFAEGFYFSDTVYYDILYTSDSSALFRGDTFFNINMEENDLRQPLFGLFALPFALVAKLCSEIFFFVPNGYAVFLTTIQILLLNISMLMVSKLLKFDRVNVVLFILLYFCCFSTVIFSFIMEQYIIGLFYLILTIYLFYECENEVNYMYLGAVSTLLTSGILFPFISRFKNWKYWLKNIFKCFIAFAGLVIIFGQLSQVLNIGDNMGKLMSYSGEKLEFIDRIMQYLAFIKSIFIAAPANFMLDAVGHFPSYRLYSVVGYSFVGIFILLLCLISVILNRKNKIAIVSGLWILFSFILLCVVGWGTAENGLILYSLYFSWAFIVLLYLLIDKIIKNTKIKCLVVIFACLFLCVINIPEYINIVEFVIEYYGN